MVSDIGISSLLTFLLDFCGYIGKAGIELKVIQGRNFFNRNPGLEGSHLQLSIDFLLKDLGLELQSAFSSF